jgi:ectoine hydroxylase-related dioxygenase (phytanoyl-CoA dioxygenase family)
MAFEALSARHVAEFEEQGYLILPAVFDADEVQRMRDEANFILELILNSSICHGRRSGRLDWNVDDTGLPHVRKIQPVNDLSRYLADISKDARLLGPMRQIMGDEPELMEEKLNYKEPLRERIEGLDIRQGNDRFPIHHDWAYYSAQNYPVDIISSAVSMDDSTADNGPLHVWPGSHRRALAHVDGPLGLEVQEGQIDPNGGIDVLAPAGSVMLFHSLLAHNSRANTTARPRRLMIYSHYPARYAMGFDVRNGPTRLRESPWELEYLRRRLAGECQPMFHAPNR